MRLRCPLKAPLLAAALSLAFAAPAGATTVVVDDTGDESVGDGNCTLREAIWATNLNTRVETPK